MKERGIALISTILIGMVLLLIGISTATYIQTGGHMYIQQHSREEALNIADGGLEWAITHFDPNAPSAIATTAPFNLGQYQVSAPTSIDGGRQVVRVDGYLPSKSNPRYHRAIQAIIQGGASSPAPAFNYAVAAGSNIQMNGDMVITSSPAPNQGNIHANGNILNESSDTVRGTTTAHGTDVYGGHSNSPIVQIPTLNSTQIDSLYQSAAAQGSHTFSQYKGTTLS
ncbi:MAG TPA: hypothetical protein V6C82_07415, partial [Chroococcales cyanobacterium]